MAVNVCTEIKTPDGKHVEDWMVKRWRPMMGWLYMVTCTFDFIIFPLIWSILQALFDQTVTQWNPITLQGAGLYHISMGAICGVSAWSRGQEKIAIHRIDNSELNESNSLNNRTSTSSSYTRTSANQKTKSVLHDTDKEDADNMIKRR